MMSVYQNSDPTIQTNKDLSDFGKEELARAALKRQHEEKLERLRDEFAMAALTGFLANPNAPAYTDLATCYEKADEALKAREQSK